MPELAEVEYYRKQWNPGIGESVNSILTHSKARIFRDSPAKSFQSLTGKKLLSSQAQAKQMLFSFSDDLYLSIHLGMSGKLLTADPAIIPDKHEHLVLKMQSVALVFSDYRMFGKAAFSKEIPTDWLNIAPPLTSASFNQRSFKAILERHPKTPLKSLLLNQSYFPGIGNWMADEILWRARIDPRQRAKMLPDELKTDLFKQIKKVCRDAIRVIATDWNTPPDSWLFNHRWNKKGICPIAKKPLEYIKIGGRTACFSPSVQKLFE